MTLLYSQIIIEPSVFECYQILDDGVTGSGMCYPVCEMMHIKDPLLLIRKPYC